MPAWNIRRPSKIPCLLIRLMTAADLKELKVIEEVIQEPEVYQEDTMDPVLCELEEKMGHFLEQYGSLSEKQLTDRRYDRFRNM